MSALDGTVVVDLTSVRSGPTCTKILADFGADVVRVERPGLDRDRIFFDQADLQRNKRSVVADLQNSRGVEILRRLATHADVLVENYRPDVKHRLGTGEVPPPVGNHHPLTAPMGVCRAKDGFMNLAVGNDDMWARLCRTLGVPDLIDDPRFANNAGRVKHRAEMDGMITERLAARPVAEWIEAMNASGVACGPICTIDQVFADPQIAGAGLVHEQKHATYGPVKVLGLPVHLSRTLPEVRTPAPVPGADTERVLEGAGYTRAEIAALAEARVIEVLR